MINGLRIAKDVWKGEPMNREDITILVIMLGCITALLIKITLEIQG